jgi:hypothetical protein
MGLLDRLLGNRTWSKNRDEKPKKDDTTFFLDADSSTSLGNVEFMRRSNTIRHTFPGNADNPGGKEMIQEVDSMDARVEKATKGLPGTGDADVSIDLTGGVPKPVKKTFAERLTASELSQRLNGASVAGVNQSGGPAPSPRKAKGEGSVGQPAISQQAVKPGSTEAWLGVAKDLNG